MSEWKKVKFLDVISLNPRISLEKGVEYPFVEMSNAVPGARRPEKDVYQKYSGGGAKFEEGDTVVARIEPCLQNGKGFQCSYKKGFGSTEFLVFRPMNIKEMDYNFLYYYMGQQSIREAMAKTMVGASGRQRVNNAVFNDLQIHLPPLSIQQDIATILSRYDSLIENYQKQIKLLEEAAQRLYKEWFVDLHFPGHENTKIVDGVPEGWEKKNINNIITFHRGYDLTHKEFVDGPYPVVGSTSIIGSHHKYKIEGPGIVTGRSGSLGVYQLIWENYWPHNTSLYISDFKGHDVFYIYCLLKTVDFTTLNSGGAIPSLNRNTLSNVPVIEPPKDLQQSFSRKSMPLFKQQKVLQSQIRLLTEARDRLLPKLMSGEIEVGKE